MSTSIHAIAGAVVIVEHSTHGVALAFVNFSFAVATSGAADLDDGALAHFGASTLLLQQAFIAIRRTGLGMILRTTSVLVVWVISVSLAMARTVYKIAF